jgi:hypothetical protein
LYDSAAEDEAPNPTPVAFVDVTADQGKVQSSVTPSLEQFPERPEDTIESIQVSASPNNGESCRLSRTSASWLRADPHVVNEEIDVQRSKCIQKGLAVTDELKDFMLIQHTSIWLAGVTFQLIILLVTASIDIWYFWRQGWLTQIVALLLRLSGTILAMLQWSSFLSYSLASRGIFPFYMYFKTPQNTYFRAGDKNIVAAQTRLDEFRIVERQRRIIHFFSARVSSLDSTFIFIARKIPLPTGIALLEADGNTFYSTCKMHSCMEEDMQWVSHRWTFESTTQVHFSRFGFPQRTLCTLLLHGGQKRHQR